MARKRGRIATYPKSGNSQFSLNEERPHWEHTPFDADLCSLSESPLPLVKWRTQPWAEN